MKLILSLIKRRNVCRRGDVAPVFLKFGTRAEMSGYKIVPWLN